MLPKITIITPTLNQGIFLERTIQSVLKQNYPHLEFFVLDGGSTDQTLEILERYRQQLCYWSEPDTGQSQAINKGLARASGDIVAFLNSDDEYEPNALLTVGQYFLKHPEAEWVCGKCRIIDESGNERYGWISRYKDLLLRFGNLHLLSVVNFIAQPAVFWKRELINEVGYFDESLSVVMDYDYWLRLIQKSPYHFIDAYLARFRIYWTSKTVRAAREHSFEEDLVVKRYVRSKVLLLAHLLHRQLIIWNYKLLFRQS